MAVVHVGRAWVVQSLSMGTEWPVRLPSRVFGRLLGSI
jgi:hypothetical protein